MSEVLPITDLRDPDIEKSLIDFGVMFYAKLDFQSHFRAQTFLETWSNILKLGLGFMYGTFNEGRLTGVIGGLISMHMFDGETVAQECFWFVHPEARGRDGVKLLTAFMAHSKRIGCKMIIMSHIDKEYSGLDALYERKGFRKFETSYVMEM